MVTSRELLKILPPASLKKKKVADRQSVPLIMELVLDAHKKYRSHYDKIANKFWKGNVKKTVRYLFDFCKAEMTYLAESAKQQTVRSPAAILETRRAWGVDCKHYAGFIAGVLDALKRSGKNITWSYMFVSYDPEDEMPEHVFVSALVDGRPCYVDPVLSSVDCRFPKFHYFQQKFPDMSLYTVNGLPGRVGAIELVRAEDWGQSGYGGGSAGVLPVKDYTQPGYIAPDIRITTMQPTGTGAPGGSSPMATYTEKTEAQKAASFAKEFIQNYWLWLVVGGVGLYLLTKKKSK